MAIQNTEVAQYFETYADLLEIEGAGPFRVRAYRNAARVLTDLPESVAGMVERSEKLDSLPGIGKDLASKIEEIVRTRRFKELDLLEHDLGPGLAELLTIEGLGPKRVKQLYDTLGISNREELRNAAEEGRLSSLPRFGEVTEQKIRAALEGSGREEKRIKLPVAEHQARALIAYLLDDSGKDEPEQDGGKPTKNDPARPFKNQERRVTAAGSLRRAKETVGDLDLVASDPQPEEMMERFSRYSEVARVISRGSTRSTAILHSGLQVDLRVVPKESYGSALHYFTGSKAHNIAIRRRAQKRKLKINEYGVFKGKHAIAGADETGVYASLELPYIEPELRENWGEIEAAEQGLLPSLISLKDIRGDLHSHTTWSDGRDELEAMARAAAAAGYSYLAITDHSPLLKMIRGLDEKRLAEQGELIDRFNVNSKGFTLLKGIEVDILEDGSLDLPDSALRRLDLTICSIHSKLKLSKEKQTERLLRAMDNKYCSIIGHLTGRILGRRQPAELDIERIIEAAAERGVVLELNAQPDRLDLRDIHCKLAKELGARLSIGTDAHAYHELAFMKYGIAQARRGWLEKGNVINSLPTSKLKKILKRF